MNKLVLTVVFLIFQTGLTTAQINPDGIDNFNFTEESILAHIKYLASDELKGRNDDSEGIILARQYISREFNSCGLIPMGDSGYVQRARVNIGVNTKNYVGSFTYSTGDKIKTLDISQFYPSKYTDNRTASGKVVFAGYGIYAPELGYNDFTDLSGAEIDVAGKIILIINGVPDAFIQQNKGFENYIDFGTKLLALRNKNPEGIIVVHGSYGKVSNNDNNNLYLDLEYTSPYCNFGIPAIFLKREASNDIFSELNLFLRKIQYDINKNFKPNCFELKDLNVTFNSEWNSFPMGNVIGYLEGCDDLLKNEVIVVGAHFDHEGIVTARSISSEYFSKIYHGADDNASGTSGVIELARQCSSRKSQFKRSILFICFDAEENGLFGSRFFTQSPLFRKLNVIAMINIDMIGRLHSDNLILEGIESSRYWKKTIERLNFKYNFIIDSLKSSSGRSDQKSFLNEGIPAIHFFTGIHEDYHTPNDTYDRINIKGTKKILDMIYDLLADLGSTDQKPLYINNDSKP